MNKIFQVFLIIAILLIYKSWFLPGFIEGGDWGGFYQSILDDFSLIPYAWSPLQGEGIGGSQIYSLWSVFSLSFPVGLLGGILGFNWDIISKFGFYYPFLLLASVTPLLLFRYCFPSNKFAILSIFIFITNTYILMVVSGGQILVGMSYALVPLTLLSFMKLIDAKQDYLKKSIMAGLILGVQIIIDLRIAYITLIAIGTYLVLMIMQNKLKVLSPSLIMAFLIMGICTIGINAFWLAPSLFTEQSAVSYFSNDYTSTDAVSYFSFAKLENSLSLLHPNWPENIFGKTGFMRPEFIFLPILAYTSLLFLGKKYQVNVKENTEQRYVLFFALLGLLGAFLAKGANEPFGEIYLWMFDNIPGFVMFRDPTKWYIFVALSYCILIPFTVSKIYNFLSHITKLSLFKFTLSVKSKIFNLQNLFILSIISLFAFLLSPIIVGGLNGTFKEKSVPKEYIQLEQFLSEQESYFRTLWVPKIQRYGYSSFHHPAIPLENLLKKSSKKNTSDLLQNKEGEKLLQSAGVKYVIVPSDSIGEIFLTDRKYDEKKYQTVIATLQKTTWLKHVKTFGKIAVFEVPQPKDHFWSMNTSLKLDYFYKNPTNYKLSVDNAKKGDKIIFSETYDRNWKAETSAGDQITSKQYDKLFNSFELQKDGDYRIDVVYLPQKFVEIGGMISLFSFILILLAIILLK